MTNLKKILVPLDGSKNSLRALEQAVSIGRKSNVTITGFHVIKFPLAFSKQIKKQYGKNVEQIMDTASKLVKKSGLTFNRIVRSDGYVGAEIVNFAHDRRFDLIIIGSRGPSPIGEIFIGSVANYVLNKSKLPVLLVK
jgi:nucleotide-binding universal stress UspA family protein